MKSFLLVLVMAATTYATASDVPSESTDENTQQACAQVLQSSFDYSKLSPFAMEQVKKLRELIQEADDAVKDVPRKADGSLEFVAYETFQKLVEISKQLQRARGYLIKSLRKGEASPPESNIASIKALRLVGQRVLTQATPPLIKASPNDWNETITIGTNFENLFDVANPIENSPILRIDQTTARYVLSLKGEPKRALSATIFKIQFRRSDERLNGFYFYSATINRTQVTFGRPNEKQWQVALDSELANNTPKADRLKKTLNKFSKAIENSLSQKNSKQEMSYLVIFNLENHYSLSPSLPKRVADVSLGRNGNVLYVYSILESFRKNPEAMRLNDISDLLGEFELEVGKTKAKFIGRVLNGDKKRR